MTENTVMKDDDVFNLLRQAEARLEAAASKTTVVSTSEPQDAAAEAIVKAPVSREEKTVRKPVVASNSETKKKVRSFRVTFT